MGCMANIIATLMDLVEQHPDFADVINQIIAFLQRFGG